MAHLRPVSVDVVQRFDVDAPLALTDRPKRDVLVLPLPQRHETCCEPDREHLNELSREMYKQEVDKLIDQINNQLPADSPKIVAPDMKYHRGIGEFAGKTYSVTGEVLTPAEYEKHLAETLPNPKEQQFIAALMPQPGWIAPRESLISS